MRFLGRLNQRFGEGIRDAVLRDLAEDRFSRPNRISLVAKGMALVVLATPVLLMLAGVALLALTWPGIPGVVLGALLIGAGFYLRPKKRANTAETYRAEDLPQLFQVLDQISDELNADQVDGVHILAHPNAYMAVFAGGERVLGLGAPLWLGLAPDERLALLSHEVAHLAVNDPARFSLTARALEVLGRWSDLFRPPEVVDQSTGVAIAFDDRGLLAQMISGSFGALFDGLAFLYERLIFADSQRAEYYADLQAAYVAGADGKARLLDKANLMPLAEEALATTYYDGRKHVPVFAQMAEVLTAPDPEQAKNARARAQEELLSVDKTHPPTRYRQDVVASLPHRRPGVPLASEIDWPGLEAELAPAFAQAEERVLSRMIRQ
ncbi:MAG: M48 family metallopeptidase [Pseudomonadota bacterium]